MSSFHVDLQSPEAGSYLQFLFAIWQQSNTHAASSNVQSPTQDSLSSVEPVAVRACGNQNRSPKQQLHLEGVGLFPRHRIRYGSPILEESRRRVRSSTPTIDEILDEIRDEVLTKAGVHHEPAAGASSSVRTPILNTFIHQTPCNTTLFPSNRQPIVGVMESSQNLDSLRNISEPQSNTLLQQHIWTFAESPISHHALPPFSSSEFFHNKTGNTWDPSLIAVELRGNDTTREWMRTGHCNHSIRLNDSLQPQTNPISQDIFACKPALDIASNQSSTPPQPQSLSIPTTPSLSQILPSAGFSTLIEPFAPTDHQNQHLPKRLRLGSSKVSFQIVPMDFNDAFTPEGAGLMSPDVFNQSFTPEDICFMSPDMRNEAWTLGPSPDSSSLHRCESFISNSPEIWSPATVSGNFDVVERMVGKRKRGAFVDLHAKEETGKTRKRKACIRCQEQKIRCVVGPVEGGPCATCLNIKGATMSNLPCLRIRIPEVRLFDKGPHPQYRWSMRWNDMKIVEIDTWDLFDREIKTILISQEVGNRCYPLKVKKIIPKPEDAMQRTWTTNEQQMVYVCAPYAITNMAKTGKMLKKFVESHIESSIKHYVPSEETLLDLTYGVAIHYAQIVANENERRLVSDTLKLWVAIRMETKSDFIVGEETLNMPRQSWDPYANNHNRVLLPPVISAQIELIMTTAVLNPLRKSVLRELHEMIRKSRKESWFTIYICMFILMHSCALLTSFEETQARKLGLETHYLFDQFMEELHKGAEILLAHFHQCNRNSHPFTIDWFSDESKKLGVFNEPQIDFMKKTCRLIGENCIRFNDIKTRGNCADNYFFIAQLYESDWKPSSTLVGPI